LSIYLVKATSRGDKRILILLNRSNGYRDVVVGDVLVDFSKNINLVCLSVELYKTSQDKSHVHGGILEKDCHLFSCLEVVLVYCLRSTETACYLEDEIDCLSVVKLDGFVREVIHKHVRGEGLELFHEPGEGRYIDYTLIPLVLRLRQTEEIPVRVSVCVVFRRGDRLCITSKGLLNFK